MSDSGKPDAERVASLLDAHAVAYIATDPGPFSEEKVSTAERRLPELRSEILALFAARSSDPRGSETEEPTVYNGRELYALARHTPTGEKT